MSNLVRNLSRFTKKEIDALFKKARRVIKHQGLHILVAPKQKEYGRILIIASRKTGNAPTRNKIRRRLKSIFYEQELYKQEYDCIVIVKKEGPLLTFEQLKKLLVQAIETKLSFS